MDSLSLITRRIADALQAEDPVRAAGIHGLTADMVRQGRTPDGIARLWLHAVMQGSAQPTADWGEQTYALLPYSQVVFDSMQRDGAEAWTFPLTLRLPASKVDAERLRQAIETVLQHHPVFTVRIDDTGMQHQQRGYRSPYVSYDIESAGEDCLLHFTSNRILGDEASLHILLRDISLAYNGQMLPADDYLEYCRARAALTRTESYRQHREWLCGQFDPLDCLTTLQPDHPEADMSHSLCAMHTIDLSQHEAAIRSCCQRYQLSINQWACLVVALSMMDYNHASLTAFTWAYMGRESARDQHIVGSLHRDIPVTLSRLPATTLPDLISMVRTQTEQGILHSDYPYTFLATDRRRWQQALNVLVQPSSVLGQPTDVLPFELMEETLPRPAYCMLDVQVREQPLSFGINYSASHYEASSIADFATLLNKYILELCAL